MTRSVPSDEMAAIERSSPAAETPRAASGAIDNTRSSSPHFQPSAAADDAALREALARRRAWTEPRRRIPEPVKVQDPPAIAGTLPVAGSAPGIGAAAAAPDREGVLMARADPVEEKANNEDLIREALRNRGVPYVWGGASRGGFDCSGFICYIFRKQRGMMLPHSASSQARLGKAVRQEELQPGDLVFFRTYRAGISHVGLYIGDNRFIHAANTRRDVRIDSLSGYYAKRLKAARRITPAPLKFSPKDLQDYLQDASEPPPAAS